MLRFDPESQSGEFSQNGLSPLPDGNRYESIQSQPPAGNQLGGQSKYLRTIEAIELTERYDQFLVRQLGDRSNSTRGWSRQGDDPRSAGVRRSDQPILQGICPLAGVSALQSRQLHAKRRHMHGLPLPVRK